MRPTPKRLRFVAAVERRLVGNLVVSELRLGGVRFRPIVDVKKEGIMESMAWRTPLGFLTAPVVPCVGWAIILGEADFQRVWRIAAFILLVSWFFSFLIAAPVYLALRRRGHVSLAQSLLAGSGIALFANVLCLMLPSGPQDYMADSGGAAMVNGHLTAHGRWDALNGCLQMGIFGAATGFAFWIIAFWRQR